MSMVECQICCAENVALKSSQCCKVNACENCWKTWLTTSQTMTCMGCHKEFDRFDVSSLLSKTYIKNKLKRHREEQLLRAEELRSDHQLLKADDTRQLAKTQIKACQDAQARLRQQLFSLQEHIWAHRAKYVEADNSFSRANRAYVRHCTSSRCDGQIIDGTCSVCREEFCDICGMVHSGSCDAKAVQNYTIVKSSTKECPACQAPIFKHDGCDDMWCTLCHTPFNWKSLKIYSTTRHTPDLDAFQQENRLIIELPGSQELANLLDKNYPYMQRSVRWSELRTRSINLLRCLRQLSDYRAAQQKDFNRRLNEARLKFLREGKERKFTSVLHRVDVDKEIDKRVAETCDEFVEKIVPILESFHDFALHHVSTTELFCLFDETSLPISAFNTQMFKMLKFYDRAFPFVDEDLDLAIRSFVRCSSDCGK